ncbi:MAG: hypothetical protein ACLTG7_07015 [Romboutsia sp.]|jgi:hypothetical protein|nr:MAG TPA: hypothetical protein [Caudoviricetes sp.]
MEDNKKLSFTYFGDIRIERANVRVIEIGAGSLKFALDERYPYYIKVYIGDSSDEGFEYIDDISGIDPKINEHIDEFETGVDLLDLKGNSDFEMEILHNGLYTQNALNRAKNIYLLSEQGYMLLVGFMNTEKAKTIRKQ